MFNCSSLMPNHTSNAERNREIEINLNVALYPTESAIKPPKSGPSKEPVTLPVCNVPSVRPAISFGVWIAMNACDIGMKPVKIPMNNLRKNNCATEVANPMSKTDNASPDADMIKTFFLPCRSPNRPQIGEKIKAVMNVTPKIQPDHRWTYSGEKLPNVSMYNEMNGKTIVMLAAMKKFANHMMVKFRLATLFS